MFELNLIKTQKAEESPSWWWANFTGVKYHQTVSLTLTHTHRHTHGAQHSQAGMSDTISLIGHERMLDFPGGRVASGSPRQTGSAEWKRGRERWGRETELNYITPTLTAGCDIEEKLSVLMLSLRFCHVPLVDAHIKLSVLSTECCPTNKTLWS